MRKIFNLTLQSALVLVMSIGLATLTPQNVWGQCDNTGASGQWPTSPVAVDPGGALTTISTNMYDADEFSQVSGMLAGSYYEFTMSSGAYITVREGAAAGPVVGAGFGPLTVQAVSSVNHFIHYTLDAACNNSGTVGTATNTVQLVPPPAPACDNTGASGQWPTSPVAVDPGGALTTISTNMYDADEFSQVSGMLAGSNYEFTMSSGAYITVREGAAAGPVIGAGFSPLTVTAVSSVNHFVHYTLDAACNTSGTVGTATNTVQLLAAPVTCCQTTGGIGCSEAPACEALICGNDAFCCNTQWDATCAAAALADCGATECAPAPPTTCCQTTGGIGCSEAPACEALICGNDAFCCNTQWDATCAAAALADCGATECAPVPPATCDYTVIAGDIFGDGWDGSVWEVREDGSPIATLTVTGCGPVSTPISVAEGAEISLWWVTGGSFTNEKAVRLLDFEGNEVYSFRGTSGSTNCPSVNWTSANSTVPGTFPSQMFSGTSACSLPTECFSSIQFGTNTAPEPGDGTVTFTTCIFAEEYRVVNGLTSAVEYEFVSFNDFTLDPAFLTIKTDADVFIQSGFSPQVVTGYTGNLHVLVNTDDACGTLQDCFALACTATLPPVCVPTWATGTFNGCQDGDVVARVLVNTLDNESGAGCPSGALGYSDYTDYSLNPEWTTELQAGTTYNVEVFAGQYGENVAVWIDYNDDNVFDNPGERVGFTTTAAPGSGFVGVTSPTSVSFPISLACNPPVGEHRMRVRAVYAFTVAGSGIEPCTTHGQWGETEDYLVTILPPPACPAPSALVASNATTGSVDLDWSVGCTETAWEVEYGAPGFTPGDGTTVPAGTNVAFLLDGLADASSYDVYVRANCDLDGLSSEFGPVSFTTLAFPPANDDCDDAEAVANNSSTPFTLVNTVAGADITSCVFNDIQDAWYSFDVPSAGTLTVDTEGSGFDTGLSLWDACGGTELACDDDGGTGTLSLITYVTSGASTIYIRVAGFNGSVGSGLVNVSFVPFPVNNDCDDATAITPVSPNVPYGLGLYAQANAVGTLWGATASGSGACGSGLDVFYSLNVPFLNHYIVSVNPFGGADVALEILDACGGTQISCTDDAGAEGAETAYLISLAAGDYTIRVSGAAASSGLGQFLLNVQAAPTSKVMDGTGCNESGLQLEDVIRCNLVASALDYEWRFVEVGGGLDASFVRSSVSNAGSTSNRNLRLSWVPGIDYNKLYNVFVRAQFDIPGYGVVWGAYREFATDLTILGASDCTVETGISVTPTQLRPEYSPNNPLSAQPHTFCNNLVATWVGQAEQFEWELDGPTFHEVQTPSYFLNLGTVAGLQAGQIYQVRVRARVNGLWGSYGVQLPAAVGLPSNTQIIASQCGTTRALNQAVAATNTCGASSYTFRFQHATEAERVVVRPGYTCPLWLVLDPLTPGETYQVSVKVSQGGVDGDYSTVCDITIAGPQAEGLADDMSVSKVATEGGLGIYPNPNAGSEVRVELNGIEEGAHNVEVTIYDIYGKLMTRDVFGHQGSQLSRLVRFENELATGMYLVHVTIDGNIFATEKLIVK